MMRGVSVLFLLGLYTTWGTAQFLNHRPYPTYSLENMPDTSFSCRDKILGGYYADVDTQCQMFHICVKVAGVGVQDFRFLCPNGTAFDQDHQICADWEDVDCDATTLYYSSDNFDLYRIGSGFESKAKKYGEDEETFALQRAETGDVRINREHQTQRVNQQKEATTYHKKQPYRANKNQENERDIFKGSSSSNFFNNKNGGKEADDDYDDNVNVNQDNDQAQRRKLSRKPVRRPVYNNQQETTQTTTIEPKRIKVQQPSSNGAKTEENRSSRPPRPTGFINNFAGSSYVPTTTSKSTTILSNDKYTVAVNNHRLRNGQRHRAPLPDRQFNNADTLRQTQSSSAPLTVSTPAPFRQTQQYNNPPNRQSTQYNNNFNQQNYQSTTPAFNNNKQTTTQNYAKPINNQQQQYNNKYNNDFDTKKVNPKQEDNYFQKTNNENKKTSHQNLNDNNYPTTFSPKSSKQYYQTTSKKFENYPTTFSPRTNQAYNTISQVTTQYNTNNPTSSNQNSNKPSNQFNNIQQFNGQYNNPQPFSSQKSSFSSPSPKSSSTNQQNNNYNTNQNYDQRQYSNNFNQQSTPKSTPFTQYTPTVPKVTTTTPSARSNRFDETQYDDGSYNAKYDYDDRKEDEFLKTAHSQNIAKSRNDLAQSQKNNKESNNKAYYESPRPFSVSTNTPKQQEYTRPPQPVTTRYSPNQSQQSKAYDNKKISPPVSTTTKKPKDVSYDYAYYDTNNGSEPEYDIDTEIKKSTVKN